MARRWAFWWRERAAKTIAWWLPSDVVMWSYIRVHAHATCGEYGHLTPDEVTWSDALKAWAKR